MNEDLLKKMHFYKENLVIVAIIHSTSSLTYFNCAHFRYIIFYLNMILLDMLN